MDKRTGKICEQCIAYRVEKPFQYLNEHCGTKNNGQCYNCPLRADCSYEAHGHPSYPHPDTVIMGKPYGSDISGGIG